MDNEPDDQFVPTICADMITGTYFCVFCDSFKCRYTQACAGSLKFITDWPAPGECQHYWCMNTRQCHSHCAAVPFLQRDASKCSPPLLTRPTIQQCPMHKDLGEDVLQHSLLKFITGQKL